MNNNNFSRGPHQITEYLEQARFMINPFNNHKRLFGSWLNKFEYVTDIICVPENKMVEFFNNMVHNDIHAQVENLFSQVNFLKLSYKEIIDLHIRYFSDSCDEYFHRSRFLLRKQYEKEPIIHYSNTLQQILTKCSYTSFKDNRLCNQFIKGIRNNELREYLNEIQCIKYEEIVEEAIEFEKVHSITPYLDKALLIINTYNLAEKDYVFHEWLNKFEYVADIIDVPDNKMVNFVDEMVNIDVQNCVKQAFPTINFSELSYECMTIHYLRYFLPNEYDLHKVRFFCRKQYKKETIEKYANNLRKIYDKCYYKFQLEEELCNQFLNGIREEGIKTHLIQNPGLSFHETLAKAIEFEKVNLTKYYLDKTLLKINTYDPQKEGFFYTWINKFEYVAEIIGVPDDKMIELFNKMIDNDAHARVKERFRNVNFSELSYELIIEKYYFHYALICDYDMNKKRFNSRMQYENESIEHYANSLQKLYNNCYYTIRVEKHLCEQFLYGIRDNEIKTHLSKTSGLSFDEIVTKAIEFAKVHLISYYLDHAFLKINTYNPNKVGFFYDWFNKFEYVADKIGVPDNKMAEFFNNMVDNYFHGNVREFNRHYNFSNLTYEKLTYLYLHYFRTKNENILHRIRFYCRKQYKDEPIEKYANCLRGIYHKCNFKSITEKVLCEQFIHGIRGNDIRSHLSKTSYLRFDEVVDDAVKFAKVNLISYYLDHALTMINIYNPKKEDTFHNWLNKFENVADKIGVPDNKMVEFFNNMMDNGIHKCVQKIDLDIKFSNLPYEQIIEHYDFHFASIYDIDFNLKRFNSRNQYEKEPIERYANSLRKLYNQCCYISGLEKQLGLRFIDGIHDKEIKAHLSKTSYLRFDEVVDDAIKFAKANLISYYLDHALSMINIYNPKKEDIFLNWLNKFEYVADKIGVPGNKMIEFFNSMVNNDVHAIVKNSLRINNSMLSYEDIIECYLNYYNNSNYTPHRTRFLYRNQFDEEPLENYANTLLKLFMKFDRSIKCEKSLCEKFLNGIRNNELRKYLKEFPNLSFNKLVAKAIQLEKFHPLTLYLDRALIMIHIYNPHEEGFFHDWLNKFEYVADIIGVSDDQMSAFFKNMVDNDVHTRVLQNFPNVNFFELPYDEIINFYLRHFSPNEVDLHRARFICRKQYEQETLEKYANNLQKIYKKCYYQDQLEEEICDQFLNGICDDKIRTHLRTTPRFSFDLMVENAIEFSKSHFLSQFVY